MRVCSPANVGDDLANKVFSHETGSVSTGYGKDISVQEAELVVKAAQPSVDLSYLGGWV